MSAIFYRSIVVGLFFTFSAWADTHNFKVQYWKKSTAQLPVLLGEEEVSLDVTLPANPGEFDVDKASLELAPFNGALTLYWIHPWPDSGNPPYFNVEIALEKPMRFYCSQSPRSNWGQLPPLVCANEFDGHLYGITLINLK